MKRINFIVSLLKGYEIVLDIGTDHGLILKKALDLKYIKKGIAVDIKSKPLSRARLNLQNYPVDFYLSNGFENLHKVSFDIVLICGMGPYTIIDILKKAPNTKKPFLLGCQGKINYLIKWIEQNNFIILNSYNVLDKFSYNFLEILQNYDK
ncbi:tRNA (adenine(22)-N(1))-methyltransferase TrmK [Candidatus Phytoplasma pini]|uniref:SAM-dependent methyltransferase n=1 Tax=Candidatus Phytoplasma pini TaxID=267362 RepID=A0A559KJ64_9MOLU|nr:tRNA (adenine(22)-N(1))-methyltransferase TrmK [Candidatus Phytoplasma pini]TVY12172.1 hypothetical protein MDPP_00294 [Candidatus Phytoplasma pini]